MVNEYGNKTVEPFEMVRNTLQPNWRKREVTTRTQKKVLVKSCPKHFYVYRRYAPIYDKGIVDAELTCYPYGYRGKPISKQF
jgi:hypothetical protein